MRILITGGSAAGKTTLAEELGAHLGLSVKHLDAIAYVDECWTPRPAEEKAATVNAIIQMPDWLVEGGHLGWTKPLFDKASAIIWLDTPFTVTLWRRFKLFRGKALRFQLSQVFWQVQSHFGSPGPDDNPNPSQAALRRDLSQQGSKVLRYRRTPSVNQVIRDIERLNA